MIPLARAYFCTGCDMLEEGPACGKCGAVGHPLAFWLNRLPVQPAEFRSLRDLTQGHRLQEFRAGNSADAESI